MARLVIFRGSASAVQVCVTALSSGLRQIPLTRPRHVLPVALSYRTRSARLVGRGRPVVTLMPSEDVMDATRAVPHDGYCVAVLAFPSEDCSAVTIPRHLRIAVLEQITFTITT